MCKYSFHGHISRSCKRLSLKKTRCIHCIRLSLESKFKVRAELLPLLSLLLFASFISLLILGKTIFCFTLFCIICLHCAFPTLFEAGLPPLNSLLYSCFTFSCYDFIYTFCCIVLMQIWHSTNESRIRLLASNISTFTTMVISAYFP